MQMNQDSSDDVMSEINMTPLVDVMLVLLIIFIVAMPIVQHSIKLNLPQATTQEQQIEPTRVNLSMNANGDLFWDNAPLSMQDLKGFAQQAAQDPNTQIHIRADKTTTYQQIASVLATLQNAGVQKMTLVTTPE